MNSNSLTSRRWQNFQANKRGFYSLWIFLGIFLTCLLAELIANDKPILLYHRNQLYSPVFFQYSEAELGGVFKTEADFKDPYVLDLIRSSEGWMLWPPVDYSFDTIDLDIGRPVPSPPSARHWLGTDDSGKDTLARLIYGLRVSILFGLLLTFFASLIGLAIGAAQGYLGGLVDLLGQRFIEIWQGLPMLFLLIILASVVEPNFYWLLIIMILFGWMPLVPLVRAEFLRARNFEYVRAARALGLTDIAIVRRHVLPNAMVATLTFLPFLLSGSITTLTALDFLGFGLPPGSASLGELLAQGKANFQAPWLGLTGFVALAVVLSLLIFLGEAVRDAFDPRKAVDAAQI